MLAAFWGRHVLRPLSPSEEQVCPRACAPGAPQVRGEFWRAGQCVPGLSGSRAVGTLADLGTWTSRRGERGLPQLLWTGLEVGGDACSTIRSHSAQFLSVCRVLGNLWGQRDQRGRVLPPGAWSGVETPVNGVAVQ